MKFLYTFRIAVFSLLLVFAAGFALAKEPFTLKKIKSPSFGLSKITIIKNPLLKKVTPSMPVIIPRPDIDYKIMKVKIDPDIDYKILSVGPNPIIPHENEKFQKYYKEFRKKYLRNKFKTPPDIYSKNTPSVFKIYPPILSHPNVIIPR